MSLCQVRQAVGALRRHNRTRLFLASTESCLAVVIATLVSQKAHRAGLPEYLTLYPVAVAAVSALWGFRHGLAAVVLSVLLARGTLLSGSPAGFGPGESSIRLFAISASTFAAAVLVGIVREQRDQLERVARALRERQEQLVAMHEALQSAEERRDEFCRDILLAVSHGKLRLCPPEEMCAHEGTAVLRTRIQEPEDITVLRHAVADLARSMGMPPERTQDLSICLGEATTNAIVHGGGGLATIYADDATLWIHVVDAGPGIDQKMLPRATLIKGYSTKASLGMGFSLMQELADSVRLCTGQDGTRLLIEMKLHPPAKDALDLSLLNIDLDDSWDVAPAPEEVPGSKFQVPG